MFARINWLLLYLLLIKPLSCLRRVPGHALLSVLGSARHALILCTVALINNEIGFSWPDSDWQLLGQELHWWHFSQKCVGLAVLHSYLHQINKKTIIPSSKLDLFCVMRELIDSEDGEIKLSLFYCSIKF